MTEMPTKIIKNLKIFSPAKINLFLHITGRRADNYHLIQTAFQFLDFSDILEFEVTQKPGISRADNHEFALPQHDLILSAANLMVEEFGLINPKGIEITLTKRIPPGSGMGGGSSNAAATLLGLNQVWQLGFDRKSLIPLARQLGADVPLFIYGKSCWATGIGDQFQPFDLNTQWYCVCIPPCSVSTAEIFNDPDLTRNHPSISKIDYSEANTSNDLEPVTKKHYPEVANALATLGEYGNARMNGSGSSIFLKCESRQQAENIRDKLPSCLNPMAVKSLKDICHYSPDD